MATIVHFDISADQPERIRQFYETLFGWKFDPVPGPVDYQLIATRGLDGEVGIGGGLAKRTAGSPAGITNFIGVASIDESLARVKELGGKVIVPKQGVPGFGYNALCTDPADNVIGLFQEDASAR